MTITTDKTVEQVAAIAKNLTKAQRKIILLGHLHFGRGYWPLYHALTNKGLVITMFGHPLTPLGLSVRAHLLGEQQ